MIEQGKRKVQNQDVDEMLLSWIMELQGQNVHISHQIIQLQAKILAGEESFKASHS